jgi:hypothetical protein
MAVVFISFSLGTEQILELPFLDKNLLGFLETVVKSVSTTL